MDAITERFLVMGLTGLVLHDLVGTMKAEVPALKPSTVDDEAGAVALVRETEGWRYAFLNLGSDAFAVSELATYLARFGTRVILLGDAAEDELARSPFPVLTRPYSSDDILNSIRKDS